jgi:hypothetical protein
MVKACGNKNIDMLIYLVVKMLNLLVFRTVEYILKWLTVLSPERSNGKYGSKKRTKKGMKKDSLGVKKSSNTLILFFVYD